MAYATEADATGLYGTDYVTTSCDRDIDGTLDSAAFALALDYATNEINGYLASRYSLPFDTDPPQLKKLCIDMAIYHASAGAPVQTEQKTKRYEYAVEYLCQVAKGKIALVPDDVAPDPVQNEVRSADLDVADDISFRAGARIFTPTSLKRL